MMPMFVYVRTGKWEMALKDPSPDSSQHYACVIEAFGKGLASVRQHDLREANRHLERLRLLMKDSLLSVRIMPFNAPLSGASVAEAILAGELSYAEGRRDEAVRWLEKGVVLEDGMIYREPKDWFIPVRHYLGAMLLRMGRVEEAKKVYREDLVHNPGNGWSLLGLNGSVSAFAGAEEVPKASVY
jgi:tetratricopeptide (TPR) repeat protein